MLAQSLRLWANIVQVLYKCFVFAGIILQLITSSVMSLSEVPTSPISSPFAAMHDYSRR